MSEQPTVVAQGPAYPAQPAPGQPYPGQPFPGSAYGPPPAGMSGPLQGPPERRVGKIIAIVLGALVVLAGLGIGALFLFGQKTIQTDSVQKEIVRITQDGVHVAPTDVHCPDGIAAAAGKTFTCTAKVEGTPVTYTVEQTDDKGNLSITSDRIVTLASVQSAAAGQVGRDLGIDVTVSCGAPGRTVVVNAPDAPIACTAVNSSDPTDTAGITVKVDKDLNVSYTFAP